jgi:hypothetical protein
VSRYAQDCVDRMTERQKDDIANGVLMLVQALVDAETRDRVHQRKQETSRVLTPADHAALARHDGLLG